jgi:hypothetical protein
VALTRRIALAVWLTVSSIQLAVWVLICVIGAHLINPFWIWGTVGGGLIVAVLQPTVSCRHVVATNRWLWWATEPKDRS